MWEILANQLLPKSLKSCPKSNKSPNLVTLATTLPFRETITHTRSLLKFRTQEQEEQKYFDSLRHFKTH